MPFPVRSFQAKLVLAFSLLLLLTACLSLVGYWIFGQQRRAEDFTHRVDEVTIRTLQAMKEEKDFFSYDATDTNFYNTGKSTHLAEHQRLMETARAQLSDLIGQPGQHDPVRVGNLYRLRLETDAYERTFQQLVTLTKKRGFVNAGLEGTMRAHAHRLEQSPEVDKVALLTMRRHEKDFIIRKDLAYAHKFTQAYYRLYATLPARHPLDTVLTQYFMGFRQLVHLEGVIGFHNQTGLQALLHRYADRVDRQARATVVATGQQSDALRHYFGWLVTTVAISALLAAVLAIYLLSRYLTKPIVQLSRHVNRAVENHFDHAQPVLSAISADEVGELTQNFNTMIQEIHQHLGQIQEKNHELATKNETLALVNEQLTLSEETQRKLNLVKDKFFFIISHDLKSPLNTLTGFLQLLQMEATSFTGEQLQAVAHSMDQSLQSVMVLLHNLLQWAGAQTGELDSRPTVLPLASVVGENIGLMAATARTKGVRLDSTVDPDFVLYADRNMFDSVLRNLLANAIKFTHAGGQVSVDAGTRGNFAEVTVRDTGVGISKENLARLFRPDLHYSTPGTAHEKGTGFGLLLCKDFVEKNGGTLSVRSQPGHGTSFSFTAPLATAAQLATTSLSSAPVADGRIPG